jgi:hypothetical protein
MAQLNIIAIILLLFLLNGCSKQPSVVCFAPVEPFQPQSGAELLEELNSHLTFRVNPRHFICKNKSDSLIGWAIVSTDKQRDTIKQELSQSSTLKLLQVESLAPELKALFKKEWSRSQTITPQKKK